MRPTLLSLSFLLSAFVLSGCGSSTCDKLIGGLESLREKGSECTTEIEEAFFEQRLELAHETCDDAEGDPLEGDKEAIDAFKECIDELDECSNDELNPWAEEANTCLGHLD